MSFLLLYNYQKKLKSLKFQTPYDTIIQIYQDNPDCFKLNPESKSLGLNKTYFTISYGNSKGDYAMLGYCNESYLVKNNIISKFP